MPDNKKEVTSWYWLLPIIFNLVGGFVAWLVLKEKNREKANKMLIVGLVICGLLFATAVGGILWLMF